MRVPFLRPFQGAEAHKLFSGGPKWGVLGGGQKVYVEKEFMCLVGPLRETRDGWTRNFHEIDEKDAPAGNS